MVAAAVVAGAAISAVGAGVAGSMAASATNNATQAGIQEQNAALSQQAQLAAPYTSLGQAAMPEYESLLGIGPGGTSGIQASLAATPGYQFALSQGEQGITNAASATGGVTGNTLEALTKYNEGVASGTYQNILGDVQGAVGIGQAAAAGQASNIGTAAGNVTSLVSQQGQTNAAIDASTIAGITGAVGGASNNYTTLAALNALNTQTPNPTAGLGG